MTFGFYEELYIYIINNPKKCAWYVKNSNTVFKTMLYDLICRHWDNRTRPPEQCLCHRPFFLITVFIITSELTTADVNKTH